MTTTMTMTLLARPLVSAVLVVRNEASVIERCLDSLDWVDEIVVVDTGSTDGTREICLRRGCRVLCEPWQGYGATKNLAVRAASNDWVFAVDADEVVSPELRDRLLREMQDNPRFHGYRPRFRTWYLGREIRHCGWSNEHHLRFFDRRLGNYTAKPLHESVRLEGALCEMDEAILHYSHPTVASHLAKIAVYSDLAARQLHEAGRRASPAMACLRGAHKFMKMYFAQRGFLDGREGLVLSVISAFGVFCKYIKLWELERSSRGGRGQGRPAEPASITEESEGVVRGASESRQVARPAAEDGVQAAGEVCREAGAGGEDAIRGGQ